MGVSVTDAKCRSLLLQRGAMTAGELAEVLGVTTGAVTGVIDRLEAAQLVRRSEDPQDRRRVVVQVNPSKRDRQWAELFAPMQQRIHAHLSSYSEKDRRLIEEFLTGATVVLEEETFRLRRGKAGAGGGAEAPLQMGPRSRRSPRPRASRSRSPRPL